ncbi:SocA family protein [Pseudomonas tolaasii]|nr:SocA family protein [Pseudomonas tolaasii]NWC52841.1 SocA family protein [Pseudomonas tolaasii]NWE66826.1 SocA family protein [Pseudomonas tolaasii]
MAAFFLCCRGGTMSYLKLMKLLYLADREAINRFNRPISDDNMVSMTHGPVLSRTLDLMKQKIPSDDWSQWITVPTAFDVSLKRALHEWDELDELSVADLNVLEDIWKKFGHMDRFQLRDYTHDNLPEWKDPGRSSQPIETSDLLEALGRNKHQAIEQASAIRERKQLRLKVLQLV